MKLIHLIAAILLALPFTALAEKTAYLGIAMTDASPALKEQLDIVGGVVVADVASDSPAIDSLNRHDVLTRFNDQMLVNSDQLSALLKKHKGGDQVVIEFVRKGRTDTTRVVLGEKEKTADERKEGEKTEGIPGVFFDGRNGELFKEMGIDLDKMKLDLKQMPGGGTKTHSSSSSSSSSVSSTVWSENGTTYQVTSNNGAKTVKITEGGKVVFEGPCNNPEDKAKIPAEFLRRIEEIQRGMLNTGTGVSLPEKPKQK